MIKSEIAAPARAEQPGKLSPWWRKLLLTVHLALSVGVIGADLSMITLGITGLMSGSAELIRASYLAMEMLADSILLPLAFAALLTGILLALGTPWGLTRYYWVLTKFVLTIAAVTALVFVLRPRISQAAANVLQVSLADLAVNGIGQVGVVVTAGPTGALLVLLTATILAVYKPWGQIRLIRHDPAPQQRTASNDL
jgi:hypothetical protein